MSMSRRSSRRQRAGHLVRRFTGSLSRREPGPADTVWVGSLLTAAEFALWQRLTAADRRHSILVARRFIGLRPTSSRPESAAALLHDIGKLDAGLGTFARVLATVVGPRTDTFRRYHDHERIGAEMLRTAGSDPVTVALVGAGSDAPAETLTALRVADDI